MGYLSELLLSLSFEKAQSLTPVLMDYLSVSCRDPPSSPALGLQVYGLTQTACLCGWSEKTWR